MAKPEEPVPLYWGERGDPNRRQVGTATLLPGGRMDLRVDDEQAQAFLAAHGPVAYSLADATPCPNCDADPQRCCREHGAHSMPHRGCILR